jgi:hypothetical protein
MKSIREKTRSQARPRHTEMPADSVMTLGVLFATLTQAMGEDRAWAEIRAAWLGGTMILIGRQLKWGDDGQTSFTDMKESVRAQSSNLLEWETWSLPPDQIANQGHDLYVETDQNNRSFFLFASRSDAAQLWPGIIAPTKIERSRTATKRNRGSPKFDEIKAKIEAHPMKTALWTMAPKAVSRLLGLPDQEIHTLSRVLKSGKSTAANLT